MEKGGKAVPRDLRVLRINGSIPSDQVGVLPLFRFLVVLCSSLKPGIGAFRGFLLLRPVGDGFSTTVAASSSDLLSWREISTQPSASPGISDCGRIVRPDDSRAADRPFSHPLSYALLGISFWKVSLIRVFHQSVPGDEADRRAEESALERALVWHFDFQFESTFSERTGCPSRRSVESGRRNADKCILIGAWKS